MNPTSMRSFPKQPLANRSLATPWVPAASRHLRWAEGITSKHVRRSRWPGLHLEAMTLTHPFRQRILRLQTMLRHTHSETRLLYAPIQQQKTVAPAGQYSQFDVSRSFAMPPQPVAERSHSMVSFVHEIHRCITVATFQRNRTLEFVEKIASSRPARLLIERTASPMSLALSPVRRTSTHLTSQSNDDDSTVTLSDRVLRKHRRIETRPFLNPSQVAPQNVPAPMPEFPTLIHRAPAQRQAQPRINALTESAPRQQAAPQAPNINVDQITEAVL